MKARHMRKTIVECKRPRTPPAVEVRVEIETYGKAIDLDVLHEAIKISVASMIESHLGVNPKVLA